LDIAPRWVGMVQQKVKQMNCDEAEIRLHCLLDNETDAEPAWHVEAHVRACPRCATQFRLHRAMRAIMSSADLRFSAPPALRARIKATLPVTAAGASYWNPVIKWFAPHRRPLFKGFAFGSALSAAATALLMIAVIRSDQDQVIVSDVVSAHLRSLQSDHLTDVQTSDQQAVKPWFSHRLGIAPPVPDLTSQGFKLIGGRVDYVLGKAVAAIVYRRSDHVINVFVAQDADVEHGARAETMQGFNVALWSERGLKLCAVGDVSAEELQEFRSKFEAAAWAAPI
jgi:anti-sigma factor (TIGR02949 family)